MKSCTEVYKYKRWREEDGFDFKPMVEIIVHEPDQQVFTLAIGLFSKVCHDIDDENVCLQQYNIGSVWTVSNHVMSC